MDPVRLIERSLHCYTLSLLGLIPVLGLPASLLALVVGFSLPVGEGESWNPARTHLLLGRLLAVLGFLGSSILVLIATLVAMQQL